MKQREIAPILPLRRIVIFPGQVTKLTLARKKSIATADFAVANGGKILLVPQLNPDAKMSKPAVYHSVGVLATVFDVVRDGGVVELYVTGQKRVQVNQVLSNPEFDEAEYDDVIEMDNSSSESSAYFDRILEILLDKVALSDTILRDVTLDINPNTIGKNELVNELASYYPYSVGLALLSDYNTETRLERIYMEMKKEIETSRVDREISNKVRANFERGQRETYLREKLGVIQKELGIGEEQEGQREKIEKLPIEDVYKQKILKDLDRCSKMSSSSAEFTLISNYIDFVLELPYEKYTEDSADLKKAKEVLDRDHFGLDKIKDRILEFLAVHHLTESNKDPILCFVGPPGVGKTTIVRSIADALGRSYVRMSLGGVHDEAEIRGHRKTYIGAMPGRIIMGIKQSGTANPIFLLDEIDKLAKDYRGDPAAALLEVLDPELNYTFRDNYLEIPFDLKDVIFITTANSLDTIPPALADRMEIIEMSGYTPLEKLEIAKRHLVKKQLDNNGLKEGQAVFTDEILSTIISKYTREAGVRQLEKAIAKVMRRVARKIVEDGVDKVEITVDTLSDFLGIAGSSGLDKYTENQVGAATGLAWTQFGGEILSIEVSVMRGKGEILLTGQLGDVLKESARASISYLRSHEAELGLDESAFKDRDIHIHIPEGAVSKDGPSAGVTLATAVFSAVTGKKVRHDIAMTGEITLRGKVLPIGGLKEKMLAAHRSGIYEIIIPFENQKNLVDVPETISKEMKVHLAKTISDVFAIAITD
ncbi:MAG: endopeptidase La [Clostridia bacterium]|nr:endopeptidase La [Clostridia bacterium]